MAIFAPGKIKCIKPLILIIHKFVRLSEIWKFKTF